MCKGGRRPAAARRSAPDLCKARKGGAACAAVKDFKLEECEIYSSCEPCPMCLSAIYWAGIRKIYFANTREDAKRIGFDDSFIYDQIPLAPSQRTVPSEEMMRAEALQAFRLWERKEDKVEY